MDVNTSELENWFSQNLVVILLVGGVLVVLWAYS